MDLSTFHHPVSDLFETASEFRLTDEQVAFFHENGYLTGVRLLSDEQVAVLREQLEPLMVSGHVGEALWHEYHSNESTNPHTVLFHALGAWRIQPAFHDALWNPRFVAAAGQLLQGNVRFWHDQLFCKPAQHGGVVAWHQDYSYWTRTKPMAHLTCWIGLDDATRDNGCLCYIPRSHEWELLPVTGLAGDMDAIQTVLSDEQRAAFQPVYAELKAGEAAFHHPLLVHGSFENRTDRPRRALVLNAMRDGVCSYSDEPLLAGIPPIPQGEKVRGQFFPLLG